MNDVLNATSGEPIVPADVRFDAGTVEEFSAWIKTWVTWHTQSLKQAVDQHTAQLATPAGELTVLQGAQAATAAGLAKAEADNAAAATRLTALQAEAQDLTAQMTDLKQRIAAAMDTLAPTRPAA